MNILIVDDDELVRDALQMVLERNDYTTVVATSAAQALELFTIHTFDAVLTDLVMPNMDGVAFIKTLREISLTCPIISLTGGARAGQNNMSQRALDAGANMNLQKPVTKNELLTALARLLKL
ncbi:MAG: response regulator [Methylocystaceae bacterium]|nr:response regulator [Methylocystaceae bacterium]